MTIDEVLERIEAEAGTARENAKANGEQTISGSFDAGRVSGLMSAAAIVAKLMEQTL